MIVGGLSRSIQTDERQEVSVAPDSLFSTKNAFSFPRFGSCKPIWAVGRIKGPVLFPVSESHAANAKVLFNGANSPANLDPLQNSHACLQRRYHAAVERTARVAPCGLLPERGGRAPSDFFEGLKSRRMVRALPPASRRTGIQFG